MTTTHPAPEEVMAWLDAEVDAERAPAIAAHVQGCDECTRVAEEFRGLTRQLAAWDAGAGPLGHAPTLPVSRHYVRWAAAAAVIIASVMVFRGTGVWTPPSPVLGVRTPPSPATGEDDGARRQFEIAWASRPRVQMPIAADDPAVTILVFIDWECLPCVTMDEAYAPIVARYRAKLPGAVRYVTKDYPLNSDCNEYVPRRIHPAACEAAAAVRIAEERGRRDEFVRWIADEGNALTAEAVRSRAETSLGLTDFSAEYARKLPEIRRDTAEGHRLNVQFTPSVFVNGVQTNDAGGGAPSATELDWAIQLELKRAGRNCADTRAC
jgi:protein-disulfide isomerase